MKLSDLEFQDTRLLVQKLCGIWLGDDKKYLVRTRLETVLKRNQLLSYSELIRQASVVSNNRLHDEIIEAITTKETSFNRDGHPFEAFRRKLLPELIANRLTRQQTTGLPFGKLRLWSAAASTGQETYSLAMGVLDYIHSQPKSPVNEFVVSSENFSILGTDISAHALAIASKGVYHERDLERGLTIEQKRKYFLETHGNYSIHPQIKDLVDFRRMDLVKPFADASYFDLILCRNLLIYFDERTRKQVIARLIESLAPNGFLMLGAVESLPTLPDGIVQQQIGKTVVFRKK